MKRFVAMVGPVFEEGEEKERIRLKVYLDEKEYEELARMAEERGVSPPKLLSLILAEWALV